MSKYPENSYPGPSSVSPDRAAGGRPERSRRRHRFAHRAALAASVGLALVAAACGSSDEGSEIGSGGGEPSGSLFAYGMGYKTADEIGTTRIDRFKKLYPKVKMKFSESGFEEQPFLSALASDQPPDVVNLPRNLIGTYIARGVLEPLDECLEQENISMDEFYPSAVDQVMVEGSAYGIPDFYNTRVWILDTKAFEDAGLDPETIDLSDWDAIAEANEKLTKVEGGKLTRIGIDPKLPEFLPLWANANGSPMISEDGKESLLEDPGIAEALEYSASLHEPAGGRTKFLDFRDTWDFFGEKNQYATGQLAAMPIEEWYLNVLAEVSPDVDITVRPFETREGDPITIQDGNTFAIPTASQNPQAACAFIRVMSEKASWIKSAEVREKMRAADDLPSTGVYTGNIEADKVIFNELVDLSDMPDFQKAVEVVLDVQPHAVGMPPSPAAAEYEEAWVNAVNEVLEGADAAEALKKADEQAQQAIDSAGR